MKYGLLIVSTLIFIGCSLNYIEKPVVKKDVSVETSKPKWLENPSYDGKLAAVGMAGYTTYDSEQEDIAINKALVKLAELSGSDIVSSSNITFTRNSNKERELYKSNTSASLITFQNIKALLTHRYKDKNGYLYVRLEKVE